jgi:tRNA-splicing ligase RtcB (3'-phosphate/5'-hydroxy nucleic acid ligase)
MREVHAAPQAVALHVWADRMDARSERALKRLARWGRFGGPIAVMPDVHSAGDVCVGTVLATADTVLPGAVGEDLGCGMQVRALDVDARGLSRPLLQRWVRAVLERIPVGSRFHPVPQELPSRLRQFSLSTRTLEHRKEWLAPRHVGTLGGGNHFVELQSDTHGKLWLTVHSGSRGIGAAIASHHARAARDGSTGPHARLGALELNSPAAEAFWSDLSWTLDFAEENRRQMAETALAVLADVLGAPPIELDRMDSPHNIIARELQPEGRTLVIHRKGAMRAGRGERGIVPGSMGTASYLVEGLGDPLSYASCSHGAGRKMARGEAHRQISPAEFRRQMGNVVFPESRDPRALLDEAPSAYKDIRTVLNQQRDLIRPLLRLEPLAVVKG